MASQPTFPLTPAPTSTHTEASASSGLGALGVDGSLLLVQAVNFFLLLAILSWLLYRPILRLLADRRRTIADGLAAAEGQIKAAAEFEQTRQTLLTEARHEAAKLLTEARAELKTEQDNLRAALKADRDKHQTELKEDRQAMERRLRADIRQSLAALLTTTAAKLFADLAQDPKTWRPKLEQIIKEMEP